MNKILMMFAALSLCVLPACTTADRINTGASIAAGVADATVANSPADLLAMTSFDEKAITLAAQAVDAMAVSATAAVSIGVIKAGSPRALALADALDKARIAINDAAIARNALNAPSYTEALARARTAIAAVRASFAGSN
jgi:hypothetical protein